MSQAVGCGNEKVARSASGVANLEGEDRTLGVSAALALDGVDHNGFECGVEETVH
jgi:hypothetical protein